MGSLPTMANKLLRVLLIANVVFCHGRTLRHKIEKRTTEERNDYEERVLQVASSWPNCYLQQANCDNIDFALVSSSFWNSILNNASFANTNWKGVGLGGSKAMDANFTGANFERAAINHVRLDRSILKYANLSGTNLQHTQITRADLTGAVVSATTDFTSTTFDSFTIFPDGKMWLTTSFFSSTIKPMRLSLDGQDVSGLNLSATANPRLADLSSCSFSHTKAHRASFRGINLSKAPMWVIQAEDVDFSFANLSGNQINYANLKRANLKNASLKGAQLQHTNMERCNIVGADLTGALLTNANLKACEYDSTTLFPLGFDPVANNLVNVNGPAVPKWPECYQKLNCDGANFAMVTDSMWHAVLQNATYINSKWDNKGFGGSNARNADFSGASLKNVAANHVNFQNSKFFGANITGANFEDSDFRGAALVSTVMTAAPNFNRAIFDSNTLFPDGKGWLQTSFFTSDLKGMRLFMEWVDVSGQDFSITANRFSSFPSCSFYQMTAHGTCFRGFDLSRCSLWQIKGNFIDLSFTDLTNVSMGWSSIQGANLDGATLINTNLEHTNMVDCRLAGADLSQARNLDSATLTGCRYDNITSFPQGFDPIAEGLVDLSQPTNSPTPAPTTPDLATLLVNTMKFDDIVCFPMGMNPASVNYYSSQWTFKNAFLESGGCCWPANSKVDGAGNLLEADSGTNSDYWIAGRNLLYRNSGMYPGGTYVLRAEGSGTIQLKFDVGPQRTINVPTEPSGYLVNVTPTNSGVELTITQTSETNPVRNISFMLQKYDTSPDPSPFSSEFITAMSGMNVLRFMDMGLTNNNNIVHWADRQTKNSISQSRATTLAWKVVSVTIPAQPSNFTQFAIELTTFEDHNLQTGQTVYLKGLTGTLLVTRVDGDDFVRNLKDIWSPKLVEVTGSNKFLISAGDWYWNPKTYSLSTIEVASVDINVTLELKPGVAYEYMIELSKETGVDPWFCVPHLATDDYVSNMARLIANSDFGPSSTLYIELSNEVWNGLFHQQWYAEARRRQLGYGTSSQVHGERSKQIFDIFETELAKIPANVRPRLNRVLATQSVNSWISEQIILGAGGTGSFDSLATAPYFAAQAADVFALSSDGKSVQGVTVTDVLELCRENIFGANRNDILNQKNMAKKYGASLIAYEGGQHLGGQGPHPLGGRLDDDRPFQDLMIATNRDPRMHNLYQAYFKLWGRISGGGVFAHFSFIGQPSKWGSWGAKETYFQQDGPEDSPKWASVKGIAQYCSAS